MSRPRCAAVFLAFALCISCGVVESLDQANHAAEHFHRQFTAGDYGAIYDEAAPEFRSRTPRERFLRRCEEVRAKLGEPKGSTRAGFFVHTKNEAFTIQVNYATTFTKGAGMESFSWRRENGKLFLAAYNVTSSLLGGKPEKAFSQSR